MSVLTGNTIWVDAVNGNDATAVPGDLTLPYLTISAAILAATAGDAIYVQPGTYNETLTHVNGVSVIGTDPVNCVLSRNVSVSETTVTMASNMVFANFTMNLIAGTSTTITGISFSGNTCATSTAQNITLVGSGSAPTAAVNGIADSGTSATDPTKHVTLSGCIIRCGGFTPASPVVALSKTSNGNTVCRNCTFDGTSFGGGGYGIAINTLTGGTTYLFGCRIVGDTQGLNMTSNQTVTADKATTFSTFSVSSGSLVRDQVSFGGYVGKDNFTATASPTTSNDATQGYLPGSQWLNSTGKTSWICLSAAAGAASWFQLTPSTVLTGNTTWVDAVNGNDSTASRGKFGTPYLTISAALTTALAGDVIMVLPGIYNEALSMKNGVSVIGTDQTNCVLLRNAGATNYTAVTMATSMAFANFTLNINAATNIIATAVSLPNTTNSTSQLFRIIVIPTVSANGSVRALDDVGTGVASPTNQWTASQCLFIGAQTGTGASGAGINKTGGVGTSVYHDCSFDGGSGTGANISAGAASPTLYFKNCRISGTSGLSLAGTSTINVDRNTSYSTVSVANTAVLQLDQTLYYPRENFAASTDPVVSNDLTQGYGVGSRWINATGSTSWVCLSAASGSAVWAQTSPLPTIPTPITNNFAATSDPTTANDVTQGYSIGSAWVNTTAPKRVWTCVSAASGAAIWRLLNNDASTQRDTFNQHFLGDRLDYPASGGLVASQVQYTRVWLESGISLNTLQVFVTSSATGNINLGLYDQATPASNSGTPHSLLASTGSTTLVSGDNGTYKTSTISGAPYTTTGAGYYWIALIGSSSTPRYAVSPSFRAGYFDGSNNPAVKFEASSGVTLPSGPSHSFNASATSAIAYSAVTE